MSDIPEEVKRQALEVAREAKVAAKMNALPVQGTSLSEVHRGPTTLPGQTVAYGRNFNPAERMPEPPQTIDPER